MKSMSATKMFVGVFTILSVFVAVVLVAQGEGAPDPTVDTIERGLELDRHKRLIARIAETDAVLSGFTTDGCSGGLSAGWENFADRFPEFAVRHGVLPPWQECCVTHDQQYHVGSAGTVSASESFEWRKQADLDLKSCVIQMGMQRSAELQKIYGLTESQVNDFYIAISELMYRAVRVGGIPCTDQPWRWGYGWPECRQEAVTQD
jgi:hypothetical protein